MVGSRVWRLEQVTCLKQGDSVDYLRALHHSGRSQGWRLAVGDMGMEQTPSDLTASWRPKVTLNLNPQGAGDSAPMNVTIKGSAGTARSLLENSVM